MMMYPTLQQDEYEYVDQARPVAMLLPICPEV